MLLRLLTVACVCASLLSLPLASLAQAVSGSSCAADPRASIQASGGEHRAHGAVFECPTDEQGTMTVVFEGVGTPTDDKQLTFRGDASYRICPAGGGACLRQGAIYYPFPQSATQVDATVTLQAAGAYVLSVTSSTEPSVGPGRADPVVCSSDDNSVCTARCRSCTQTRTVTCYYKDPAGLAAAIAASPTGGVGSNDGTIIGAAQPPACDSPAPAAPTTPPPSTGGIIGDPQFVGLRGQQYQVHGVSGEVYNIVSSAALQYNARFVFLDSGACPVVDGKLQRKGCYSHPGSYLGELGLKTAGERELIRLEAGGAKRGFAAVTLNERELAVGETALLEGGGGFIARNSSHVVSVSVGAWAFVFDNSDMFVNQRVAVSGDASALRSHGLLGQTWREQSYPRSPIKFIQGKVDDYVIREGDVFGDSFAFNAFN